MAPKPRWRRKPGWAFKPAARLPFPCPSRPEIVLFMRAWCGLVNVEVAEYHAITAGKYEVPHRAGRAADERPPESPERRAKRHSCRFEWGAAAPRAGPQAMPGGQCR